MEYIQVSDQFCMKEPCALTVGKFDGLHRGHQEIIRRLLAIREEKKIKTAVVTFSINPRQAVSGTVPQTLLTRQETVETLASLGVDYLLEIPFSDRLRRMAPKDFVEEMLLCQFGMAHMVVGEDFSFGYQKAGNVAMLRESLTGICPVEAIPRYKVEDEIVSSTAIRRYITEGNLDRACMMLGRPFEITGTVVHGRRLGRTLGFPTANLIPPAGKLLPPFGVYEACVTFKGQDYKAMVNIGVKPTVTEENTVVLEAFLLGFTGDLYGEKIRVGLTKFLRKERKFNNIQELQRQIQIDVEQL